MFEHHQSTKLGTTCARFSTLEAAQTAALIGGFTEELINNEFLCPLVAKKLLRDETADLLRKKFNEYELRGTRLALLSFYEPEGVTKLAADVGPYPHIVDLVTENQDYVAAAILMLDQRCTAEQVKQLCKVGPLPTLTAIATGKIFGSAKKIKKLQISMDANITVRERRLWEDAITHLCNTRCEVAWEMSKVTPVLVAKSHAVETEELARSLAFAGDTYALPWTKDVDTVRDVVQALRENPHTPQKIVQALILAQAMGPAWGKAAPWCNRYGFMSIFQSAIDGSALSAIDDLRWSLELFATCGPIAGVSLCEQLNHAIKYRGGQHKLPVMVKTALARELLENNWSEDQLDSKLGNMLRQWLQDGEGQVTPETVAQGDFLIQETAGRENGWKGGNDLAVLEKALGNNALSWSEAYDLFGSFSGTVEELVAVICTNRDE